MCLRRGRVGGQAGNDGEQVREGNVGTAAEEFWRSLA